MIRRIVDVVFYTTNDLNLPLARRYETKGVF
jgi:hypothetical protein